jgi:hypothetical protein
MTFQAMGSKLEIDGVSAYFSSHLAAFEAGMRLRDASWLPLHGRVTYFDDKDLSIYIELEKKLCP